MIATLNVAENLSAVQRRIAEAAQASGRTADDVTLIAVSKTQSSESVLAAVSAGQFVFGENYALEALEKIDALEGKVNQNLEWHFIGHLQSKKAKLISGKFSLIHSVDRIKIATEIAKFAELSQKPQDILLQINLAPELDTESSKQGISMNDAPALIDEIQKIPWLRLRGLMALPPLTDDERIGRKHFANLRECLHQWRDQYVSAHPELFNFLSMGTSSDYEWAILEGATHVRVGTSIFGARTKLA